MRSFNKTTKSGINTYDLSGGYGIGYAQDNRKFYFDLDDYDKIKDYYWSIKDSGYVFTRIKDTREYLSMHRLVTDVSKDKDVDHKDHKCNNNQKYNLRICTESQNGRNCKKQKNNISGYTGVSWHNNNNKWMSYITILGKRIHLGYYDDINDALAIRKQAEEKYFKEWSYDKSIQSVD